MKENPIYIFSCLTEDRQGKKKKKKKKKKDKDRHRKQKRGRLTFHLKIGRHSKSQ
jgi:hypothetical protein